jgi:hypothetical protein
MRIPVGDLLRALVPSNWGIVRKLLEAVKGTEIKTKGGTVIALDLNQSAVPPPRTGLDQPHQPNSGPAPWGPRR